MKNTVITICVLIAIGASAQRYSLQIDAEGNIIGKTTIVQKNKLVVLDESEPAAAGYIAAYSSGGLSDTGVSVSNFVWQVGYTNVSQILSSVGQANGIARLDENGKIDSSLIDEIVVVFVGGEAVAP